MSELKSDAVPSSQSAETTVNQDQSANADDLNTENVMSKSKARYLRRKRARQRRQREKAVANGEAKAQEGKGSEPQDKENDSAQSPQAHEVSDQKQVKENNNGQSSQGSETGKKKKKPRKKKSKTKVTDGQKTDVVENNNVALTSSTVTPMDIHNVKSEVIKPNAEKTTVTKDVNPAKEEVAPVVVEDVGENLEETEVSPTETNQIVGTEVTASEPDTTQITDPVVGIKIRATVDTTQTIVFDDDNATNSGKKEDCECACVVM
mmetsp:Transcript_34535/g.81421  ORF Transcript_34535/g.81421 Transcript_34535/m.81421 type:complete len:263 (+) Transcript_34535:55-843(+)